MVSSAKGWTISPGPRTTHTEPTQGVDYAALVAAHSRILGQLSSEIADKIKEMEAQKPDIKPSDDKLKYPGGHMLVNGKGKIGRKIGTNRDGKSGKIGTGSHYTDT
ncbi:MAG: PqiC family protein [Desulfobacterales bacterium]|nr:PqiC family protein [Desulfobacterales bacterium]